MKKEELRIGQYVYVIEPYTELIHRYKVTGFRTDPTVGEYVMLHGAEKDAVNTTGKLLSKVYPTYRAAEAAQKAKDEELCNKYREQIQTIGDLIQFMYDNTVSCAEEYTDWTARKIAKEKAAEFGYPIDE